MAESCRPGSRSSWQAPGRVNLIGEHTDYNDGFVLPFAIDRSVRVAGIARTDGVLDLRSEQAGRLSVPLAEVESVTGWARYPAGVAWALAEAGYPCTGASLVIDSDLPQGAGLASSAALECAVAACLADLGGLTLARSEIAALAWRAENEFVGMPCGIMDQSAVMLCEPGRALLLDCRTGESDLVPLEMDGLSLVVIDTGVRHELTGGDYAARRRECESAARRLGVPSLREIPDESALAGLTDPVLFRRARHVVTENDRVRAVATLLRSGGLADCGALLTASHRSLREDFEVSWPEADSAVETAIDAGALGARMTGGGFGGCVIALVPATRMRHVTDALAPATAVVQVAPSGGARRIGQAGSG